MRELAIRFSIWAGEKLETPMLWTLPVARRASMACQVCGRRLLVSGPRGITLRINLH